MSAIPNLLKIGEIPSNMLMDVETSIVEPVVQTESFVRFNLQRSGFLHSNSKLLLSLDASSFAANKRTGTVAGGNAPEGPKGDCVFPAGIGISNLVQRVRLLSGNTVIQEIDDWNHLEAYKAIFVANENNKEKAQFTEAKLMNQQFLYRDQDTDVATQRSDVVSTGVAIDTGIEYDSSLADGVDDNRELNPRRCQKLSNDPVYQINLASLVPFLKSTQLPLFMFSEQLYLEVSLVPATERAVASSHQMAGTAAEKAVSFTMNSNETRLVVDYISYPEDTMNQWAAANKNMNFTYFDYELSKFTVDPAVAASGFIRNCGGAGKLVTKMICGLSQDTTDEQAARSILGKTVAVHPPQDATKSSETVITNLRFNDNYLYPISVKNDSYHFNNVLAAEGVPPFVTRDQFSQQGSSTDAARFNGYQQSANDNLGAIGGGLRGNFFWQSFKLNRNERINQKGIELYQQYTSLVAGNHTLRIWLEVVKVAQLVDGKLRSEYA
mgnify:FL=1